MMKRFTPLLNTVRGEVTPVVVLVDDHPQSSLSSFKFMITDPALAELIQTQPNARAARSEAGFQRAHQRPDWFSSK
jgi:hypothetical protein